MSLPTHAVLLLAFGGPESLENIESYLEKIMRGRKPSPKQVKEIKSRYERIGGKSPLNEITTRQAVALQKRLAQDNGTSIQVFVGMRYWAPFIKETIDTILTHTSITNIIAIIMAPQRSDFTEKGYKNEIDKAIEGVKSRPNISLICDFFDNKFYLQTVANAVCAGFSSFKDGKTKVIFSAHSLPVQFMGPNDPYLEQIKKTIDGVLSFTGPVDWRLAFQSKGMAPGDWLSPSVDSIMETLPGEGYGNVLIAPIGFACDHVETLYDIDIVYKEKAESLGLCFKRSESLNDSPGFIEALHQIVTDRMGD